MSSLLAVGGRGWYCGCYLGNGVKLRLFVLWGGWRLAMRVVSSADSSGCSHLPWAFTGPVLLVMGDPLFGLLMALRNV